MDYQIVTCPAELVQKSGCQPRGYNGYATAGIESVPDEHLDPGLSNGASTQNPTYDNGTAPVSASASHPHIRPVGTASVGTS